MQPIQFSGPSVHFPTSIVSILLFIPCQAETDCRGSNMCFIESKWSIYQIERNSLGNGLTVPSNWKGNKLPIPHSEPIQTVEGPLLGDKLWDKLIGFSVKTHRQCRTFVKLRTLSNANQVEFKFERFVFEYNWWENHSISAADCFFSNGSLALT